jgi:hypothetical protein
MANRGDNMQSATSRSRSIAVKEKHLRVVNDNFDAIIEALNIQTVC